MLVNDTIIGKYYINSYENGAFNLTEYVQNQKSISHKITSPLIVSYANLSIDIETKIFHDFSLETLKQMNDIEVLLIGTGEKHRFPRKEIYCQLANSPFSIDFMSTKAACRTFNILINENRKVAALLFIK